MEKNVYISIDNANMCSLWGDPVTTNKLYQAFLIRHPDAWHILMHQRRGGHQWDGYIKYISATGKFRIGLLPKVYHTAQELGAKVTIEDNRKPLGVKPIIPTKLSDRELYPEQINALKALLNNKIGGVPFLICAGDYSVGAGKCIGKDSLVFTNKGILKISDMVDTHGNLVENYMVLSSDGYYHRVTHGVYNKIKAIEITTKLGYKQICGYDNHRYFTVNNSGELTWVLANTLKAGDYIPIYKTYNKNKKQSSKIDLDLAYLAGNLHGDGHLARRSATRISGMDHENMYEVLRILSTITKTETKISPHHRFNGWKISKSDKRLSRVLISRFPEICCGSHEKTIPQYILNSPFDIKCQYIAGLFDTDGSLDSDNNCYSLSSVSRDCIIKLRVLLLSIGIHSFTSPHKVTFNGKKSIAYRIRIPSTQSQRFSDIIPLRILRKKRITDTLRNNYDDRLPDVIGNKVISLYRGNRLRRKTRLCQDRAIMKQLTTPSRLTRKALRILLNDTPDEYLSYFLKFSDNVYWDKVKSIRVIDEYPCYDICVEGTHNYIADGFICHNTTLFASIHEAFQRKLKTILLLNDSNLFNQFKREIPPMLAGEDIQFIQGGNGGTLMLQWYNHYQET